ncbi:hypothetical protein QBC47DRAFT_396778 [Echria macrotheca]|uniref:Uncharacterized protein n=1 Tax=Echria macrotheca TaxID=438768 RepID=A0AAJ0BM41_9PEZI|nr:hypothetical protein QBC47DRAFT_396778 [Echria macrotheca]
MVLYEMEALWTLEDGVVLAFRFLFMFLSWMLLKSLMLMPYQLSRVLQRAAMTFQRMEGLAIRRKQPVLAFEVLLVSQCTTLFSRS